MLEFLLLPLFAGLGIALVAGPLGAFVVWRRMAYFGDTLAHAALLGIALGIVLSINVNVAVIFGCGTLAMILLALQHNRTLATDTLLGILSHSTLAVGLIIVSLLPGQSINIQSYLFGDLLAVGMTDVITVYGICGVVLLVLCLLWRQFLAITVQEELAYVEGIPVTRLKAILMVLMALVIAIAMKIVGVLLITALLIIPAAAARRLSHSPEAMAIIAAIIGMMAVVGGIASSATWDTPTGPSVVVAALVCFLLALLRKQTN